MKIFLLIGILAYVVHGNIEIKVVQKICMSGDCDDDQEDDDVEATIPASSLKEAEAALARVEKDIAQLEDSLSKAEQSASAVQNAGSAAKDLVSNAQGGKSKRHRRQTNSNVTLTSCDDHSSTIQGTPLQVTLLVVQGILDELKNIVTTLNAKKLNCFIALANDLSGKFKKGSIANVGDATTLLNLATQVSSAVNTSTASIELKTTELKASLQAKKTEMASLQQQIQNLGGPVVGSPVASPAPSPENIIAVTDPRYTPSPATISGAPAGGAGHDSDAIGGNGLMFDKEMCAAVLCPEQPEGDCVQIQSETDCCATWICGDSPRNCTSENGTIYQVSESWTEGSCVDCYCGNGWNGVQKYCHPMMYCPPSPHWACVSLGVKDGTCCEDYFCDNTTCLSENRYHSIGEVWQLSSDPCQTCECKKGEIPEISCNYTENQCLPAPGPGCRPLKFSDECCAHDWDCSDEYLITMPKKWIRSQQASVCVFTVSEAGTVSINLSFDLRDTVNSKAQAMLQENAAGGTYVCVNLTVPEDISSTATLSISGQVATANVTKRLLVGVASVGQTFVQTDKYLYMPGQLVQFRILTIISTRALISYENVSEVWIISPGGSRLAQWTNVENSIGLVQLQFPLANEVEEGEYKIFVDINGNQVSQVFKVEKYVLPRFSVTIQPPPYVLRSDTEMIFHICSQYTYGQPVTGTLHFNIKKEMYYWNYYVNYEPEDHLISISEILTGCTNISVSPNNTGNGPIWQPLIVTAAVTEEGTGIEMNTSITLSLSDYALKLELMTTEMYYKPGLPYILQVKASKPDASAAIGELISVCVQSICKNYTSDEHGFVNAIIPPHLMTEPQTSIQINELNGTNKVGPMGSVNSYPMYLSITTYHSPSSSSLSLDLQYDSIRCGQDANSASVPVSFVANDTDSTEIRIQLVSRSQIIWTGSMEVNFVASNLPINESQLLEPMQPLEDGLVRGTFSIDIPLTSSISPTLNILIWYSRSDGEVVSASVRIDVGKCLSNPTTLTWNSLNSVPAPKDEATIKISSSPNSVCGLGVVDRSVEMLSRGQPGKLYVSSIFNALSNAEVQDWEYSQIDDSYYCYGNDYSSNDYGGFPLLGIADRKKRSKYNYGRSGSSYVDAIKSFEGAGLLVVSDLTLETRPCDPLPLYSYGGGWGFGGGAEGAIDYNFAMYDQVMAAPQPSQPSAEKDGADPSEVKSEERSYFPETWLWKLLVISESGSAVENVQLPDTITEWVGEAVCAHPKLGVGFSATSSITTFTPFFLDLSLPPVARRGENVPVLVSIFNYYGQNLPVVVTLHESSGYSSSSYLTQICVDADGKTVIEFYVTPLEVGKINLTLSANITTFDEYCADTVEIYKSDVIIKPLSVQFEGVMKENTYSDYMCSNDSTVSWYVDTPEDIVADSERVHVYVSADLLGPTLENLGHLIRMPYGCGEQNMLNFAPNIFILQYLIASDQDTPKIVQTVKDYMIAGYQQELTYRHTDGSYSAFGNSDPEGSTWLTAFVLKSFAHAAEYITVDQNDLQVSKDWLLSLQDKNGCFASVGSVIHKDMEGGLDTSENALAPLTAYVLVSVLETSLGVDPGSINNAISCILTDSSTNAYTNSLKAYAFALASNSGAGALINSVYSDLTADSSDLPEPILVEAAGYLLLAMIKSDPSSYVAQAVNIAKLISSHRNGQGGFVSTQDTVVALQALATFSEAYPPSNSSLNLNVHADQHQLSFSVSSANRLLLQTQDIDTPTPYNVTVSASGEGCAVVMVVQRYNVPAESESSAFSMMLKVDMENCTYTAELQICFSYLHDDGESNMAVLNIEPVTGFIIDKRNLEKLLSTGVIKRFEEVEGIVNLYLQSVTANETCISVFAERKLDVYNAKPGSVTLYDYYQPSLRISKSLQISNDCPANSTVYV